MMTRLDVFVDEPGFDRHQPGFGYDEDRECQLDRGAAPVVFASIGSTNSVSHIEVRDHRHADDP